LHVYRTINRAKTVNCKADCLACGGFISSCKSVALGALNHFFCRNPNLPRPGPEENKNCRSGKAPLGLYWLSDQLAYCLGGRYVAVIDTQNYYSIYLPFCQKITYCNKYASYVQCAYDLCYNYCDTQNYYSISI